MRNNADLHEQIAQTYERIERDARYRPNDDVGRSVRTWSGEEEEQLFEIGCPDFADRPALIYMVEAARLLCGMEYAAARKLLALAAQEIDGKESVNEIMRKDGYTL